MSEPTCVCSWFVSTWHGAMPILWYLLFVVHAFAERDIQRGLLPFSFLCCTNFANWYTHILRSIDEPARFAPFAPRWICCLFPHRRTGMHANHMNFDLSDTPTRWTDYTSCNAKLHSRRSVKRVQLFCRFVRVSFTFSTHLNSLRAL